MDFTYTSFLHDPLNKAHDVIGPKSREWNEYQRVAKINALELKYPYSREQLVRLAAIKRGIYNPVLPTLRKIDRDDVLCKLSDEHSRHTTFVDKSIFNDSSLYLNYPRGREPLWNKSLSDLWSEEEERSRANYLSNSSVRWRKPKSAKPRILKSIDFSLGPHRREAETKDSIEKFDQIKADHKTFNGKYHESLYF